MLTTKEEQDEQDGDEHTLSMVDDGNVVVELGIDKDERSPLKFDNPLNGADVDEPSGSDSETEIGRAHV